MTFKSNFQVSLEEIKSYLEKDDIFINLLSIEPEQGLAVISMYTENCINFVAAFYEAGFSVGEDTIKVVSKTDTESVGNGFRSELTLQSNKELFTTSNTQLEMDLDSLVVMRMGDSKYVINKTGPGRITKGK